MGSDSLELVRKLSVDLQQRAGEIETILDLLPIGIALADDPECRAVRVNRALADLLGLEGSERMSLRGPAVQPAWFKTSRDGRPLPLDDTPMRRAGATGSEIDGALDIVRGDGRRMSVIEYAAPLFDAEGKVRGAIGIFVDITERRRIEREQRFLAEASRLLSSSLDYQETLRALARLAVPMFGDYCALDVIDDDGNFERAEMIVLDPARQDIADGLRRYPPVLSVDSPASRAIKSGQLVLADDVPMEVLEKAAQSAEHFDLMVAFGVRAYMMIPLRTRGRTRGLLTAGTFGARTYDERDAALAADIASRAALALDSAMLYRDAQEANRIKEEFLATLSHELRTPLNALLGWTQMLKVSALDETSKKRALDSIERNAQAQAVLINDLLDLSRVISGKLRLDERPIDLPMVVLAAVDACRPAVRAREIELNVVLGTVKGQVIGDPDRLQQVVWNLLSNAVKFTPVGGRIELGVEELGGAVQIAVSDNGAGIDAAFLPHVFERFRQADSSTTRAQGGLGLGLAIVRHLVDLHGGAVAVESDGPGTGARFTVTLPTHQAAVSKREPSSAPAIATPLKGIRVLAVDDDEDSRELILMTVRGAGAEVMVVNSGASALDALPAFRPHVVVADIAMPGMDGFGLMREMQAMDGDQPKPAVIALSAYVTAEDTDRSREAGFACHLGKPADYERLVAEIAAAAAINPRRRHTD